MLSLSSLRWLVSLAIALCAPSLAFAAVDSGDTDDKKNFNLMLIFSSPSPFIKHNLPYLGVA